jgi:tRNA threonylcarbamoyladenosine biosynthesis protein TsaB
MILALRSTGAEAEIWLLHPEDAAMPNKPTRAWESGRNLADELLGEITKVLVNQDAELASITGIIVFSGPGSFTSLRIIHAVANALADSLSVPVCGAMGEMWLKDGLGKLPQTALGLPALPTYGGEANVTKPS